MDDLEQLLDEGDIFSRISPYELERNDGRVFIFVQEVLAGERKGLFVAYPAFIIRETKDEYIATGTSHEEALRKCLSQIKGVPTRQMMTEAVTS